jgi:peptidoglycan/LPS O-acetylase OafA/YrhL
MERDTSLIVKNNSLKFSQLYFLLSLLVVFIHSYTFYSNVENLHWIFQKTISDNISRITVPLFFAISGFFLFLKYENSWDNYKDLIRKKTRTLVVPYFLWSITTFVLMFLIQSVYPHLNQELIVEKSVWENIISVLLGDNTVLWFVRILFIMTLLAPVLKIVVSNKYLYIPVLIVLFALDFTDNGFNFWFLKLDSLLYFVIGGVISQNSYLLEKRINIYLLLALSIVFAAANIYMDWGTNTHVNDVNLFERLFIISFSLFVWNCRHIYKLMDKVPNKYYHYSFTIYMLHAHIIVMVFKESLSFLIPNSTIVYILTGFITFTFCLALSIFLEKYTPGVYRIFSGGRKSRT